MGILSAVLSVGGCQDDDITGPSEATHLVFGAEPSPMALGDPLLPSTAVLARDDDGETVWTWSEAVSLSLVADGAGAVLLGSTTVNPVGGTAIFDDLAVTEAGSGFRLVATSGSLEEAVSQPFRIHDGFRSAAVASGREHTCALADDGVAYCWGRNAEGQLGDGTKENRALPTPVSTGARFESLSSGPYHTCGLTADGVAFCWGANGEGQLGAPTTEDCGAEAESAKPCSTLPIPVTGEIQWSQVSAGDSHSCGLAMGGEAYCWGSNALGQLGDGTFVGRADPTPVSGEHSFTQVVAGYVHSCGLLPDGQAYCWGSNIYGEVGDGTNDRRTEPVLVHGDHRFLAIDAGGVSCHGQTCGVATDGTAYCWGHIRQPPDYAKVPRAVEGDPGFMTVLIGSKQVCGLRADGATYCWGEGYSGSLGTGGTQDQTYPTAVLGDLGFASLSVGHFHTCGVASDGFTYCWGENGSGQLGNQSIAPGWNVPVKVWGF